MSEFEDLREELDDLRNRVVYLEFNDKLTSNISARASAAARTADRTVAKTRTEWREVAKDLEAGITQIISLLTPEADAPARRPENTQSASDKPLT